jgi:hypothetical protein
VWGGKDTMDRSYALSLPLANDFNAYVNAALDNNEISKDEWYEINKVYFTNLYLSYDNPRAQSGHSGDAFHYLYSHMQILDAIYKDGTFCDIGCANGHLMEMVYKWALGVGFNLQMFGLDISEGLIEFSRKRLPEWHDNFFVGNAHFWKPEKKFDYIHMRAETVEEPRLDGRYIIFSHYWENYLNVGGRLIIGPYWYTNDDSVQRQILDWGISPKGYSEKSDYRESSKIKKVLWFEKV